jgi:hypothetical protein
LEERLTITNNTLNFNKYYKLIKKKDTKIFPEPPIFKLPKQENSQQIKTKEIAFIPSEMWKNILNVIIMGKLNDFVKLRGVCKGFYIVVEDMLSNPNLAKFYNYNIIHFITLNHLNNLNNTKCTSALSKLQYLNYKNIEVYLQETLYFLNSIFTREGDLIDISFNRIAHPKSHFTSGFMFRRTRIIPTKYLSNITVKIPVDLKDYSAKSIYDTIQTFGKNKIKIILVFENLKNNNLYFLDDTLNSLDKINLSLKECKPQELPNFINVVNTRTNKIFNLELPKYHLHNEELHYILRLFNNLEKFSYYNNKNNKYELIKNKQNIINFYENLKINNYNPTDLFVENDDRSYEKPSPEKNFLDIIRREFNRPTSNKAGSRLNTMIEKRRQKEEKEKKEKENERRKSLDFYW